MACGTCPDAVTFTLRSKVEIALDQVRSIKELSFNYNRALQDVAGLAEGVVASIAAAIPDVPGLDFGDILGYLTCPLTPLALALGNLNEFTELDPRVQLARLRGLIRAEIEYARRGFEDALAQIDFRNVVDIARKYVNEFLRIRFDAVAFAEAVVITATVYAVCGEDEYVEGPYLDFANEVQDFSLTGGVPSSLDVNVAAIVQRLLEAETKFTALQASLVAL